MLNNRPKWNDILTGATSSTSTTTNTLSTTQVAHKSLEEYNRLSLEERNVQNNENQISLKGKNIDTERDIQLSFPFAPLAEPNSSDNFKCNFIDDEENRILMSKVFDSIPMSIFHQSLGTSSSYDNDNLSRSSTPIGPLKSANIAMTGVFEGRPQFNMLHIRDDHIGNHEEMDDNIPSTPPKTKVNTTNLFSKTTSDLLEGLLAPGPSGRRRVVNLQDKNSNPNSESSPFDSDLSHTIGSFDALDIFSSTSISAPITSSTPNTPSNRQRGSSFDYNSGSSSRLGRRHSSLFGLTEWDSEFEVGTLMGNGDLTNSSFGNMNQMTLQSSIIPPHPQALSTSFNIDELLESSSQFVNTNGTISRSASLTGNSLTPMGRSNCPIGLGISGVSGLGFNGVSSLNPLTNQNSPVNRRHSINANGSSVDIKAPWEEAANALAAAGVPMPSKEVGPISFSSSGKDGIRSFVSQAFNPSSAVFLPNSSSNSIIINNNFDLDDESSYISSAPLPPLTSQYSQGDLALSVKSQWKMSTAKGSLYALEFKAGRTEIFYVLEDLEGKPLIPSIKLGDLCIVEADRGEDLGKVTVEIPMAKLRSLLSNNSNQTHESSPDSDILTHELASLIQAREIIPKRIHRLTHDSELRPHLSHKSQEEAIAMVRCQARIKQKKLPMEVVDAEYQWDRNKLTFYFSADRRIDFRELVRDLFRIYKTRIWMCAVDKNAGSRMVLYNSASTGGPAFLTTPSSKF